MNAHLPHQGTQHSHKAAIPFCGHWQHQPRQTQPNAKALKNTCKMHCIKGIQPFVVSVRECSCFCNGCRGDDACAYSDVSGQWTVTELMPPSRWPNRQVQLPIQHDTSAQPEPVVPRRRQNHQQFPIQPDTPAQPHSPGLAQPDPHAPAQPDPPALTLPELVPPRRRASRWQQQPVQLIPPIQTDTHVQLDQPTLTPQTSLTPQPTLTPQTSLMPQSSWNHTNLTPLDSLTSLSSWTQPSLCLLYTSPSPRDVHKSRMPSSA